jgi:NitT/TauT family transport system substrate-binding protein
MSHLVIIGHRSAAYLPHFVANRQGYFLEEGLTVEERFYAGPWSQLAQQACQEEALLVGSPLYAFMNYGTPNGVVPFASCGRQCRYVLARRAREGSDTFEWAHLVGKNIMLPPMPTVWVAFWQALAAMSVNADGVRPMTFESPEGVAATAFIAGAADYIVVSPEQAQDGQLQEVAALADAIGPVPWSVYQAPQSVSNSRAQELEAFSNGIGRALHWIASSDTKELAGCLPDGADGQQPISVGAIQRYKSLHFWPLEADIVANEMKRWQAALREHGLVSTLVPQYHHRWMRD